MIEQFNISLEKAWALLKVNQTSFLVDVRSYAEWSIVGVPDLSSLYKEICLIEWSSFPEGTLNPNFLDKLSKVGAKNDTFIFICRSGARSLAACGKAYDYGYKNVFNLQEGFEGPLNDKNQRSQVMGWKFSKLPWHQN